MFYGFRSWKIFPLGFLPFPDVLSSRENFSLARDSELLQSGQFFSFHLRSLAMSSSLLCVSKTKNRSIYFVSRVAIVNAPLSPASRSTRDLTIALCYSARAASRSQLLLSCELTSRSAIIHSLLTGLLDESRIIFGTHVKQRHGSVKLRCNDKLSEKSFATLRMPEERLAKFRLIQFRSGRAQKLFCRRNKYTIIHLLNLRYHA